MLSLNDYKAEKPCTSQNPIIWQNISSTALDSKKNYRQGDFVDPKSHFMNHLQGLRAIAVILVILAHAGATMFPGGFVGVDVFFVLSGYLITLLLLREAATTGDINFLNFYGRRVKRLLPALVLMLFVTMAAATWLLTASEAHEKLGSSVYAATWLSNFYFAFNTIDYFNEFSSKDFFLHTWSLGVEEQFYLIWPMLLLWLFKLQSRRESTTQSAESTIWIAMAAIILVGLATSVYWSQIDAKTAFYMLPARIWQFALGGILALSSTRRSALEFSAARSQPLISTLLLAGGLTLILLSSLLLTPNIKYPSGWAALPSVGTALVIAGGRLPTPLRKAILENPLMVWLGDRSYSLYLWHWPVLILGFALGYEGQLLPVICLMLVTLLAAVISYRCVEYPLWKGKWSHFQSRPSILTGLALMLVTALSLNMGNSDLASRKQTQDISAQWRADLPVIYKMPCDTWYKSADVQPCTFGNADAKAKVILLGDSVGAQWFTGLAGAILDENTQFIVYTKSACAIVDEDYFYQRIGDVFHICTQWRNAVIKEIEEIRPTTIIIGSSSVYEFSDEQWLEGSARVLEKLTHITKQILIIPGTPTLGFDGPGCVARNLGVNGAIDSQVCLAKDRLLHTNHVTNLLKLASDRFSNAHVVDLNCLVCPAGACNAISKDGLVVFRDDKHLADSFVKSRTALIREQIIAFP